mgnify:CR=1
MMKISTNRANMLRQRFNKLRGEVLPYLNSIEAILQKQNDNLEREYFKTKGRLAEECLDNSIAIKLKVIQKFKRPL